MTRTSTNWIVGKRVDLAAFIGGALAGYLVFFMHAGLGWDMVLIYVLFITFMDTPHFFGTYLRTYLDRAEFRVRKAFLLASLLWLLAGPAMLLACYGLYAAGFVHYMAPFDVFILAVGIWAYWHVVRQHYGFMRLYQVKNGENALKDRRRDGLLMHLGLVLPFIVFVLRHHESREAFGLPATMAALPTWSELGGVSGLLSGKWLASLGWEEWVIGACTVALVGLIADFVVRQFGKWKNGEKLNIPKILLFSAVLPLHIIVCYSAAVLTAPLVTFSAFVTIYHDIQYHVLVYCHQRNRFRDPAVAKEAGIAAFLSRNILLFFGSAVAFGVLVRGFGCGIQVYDGAQCFSPKLISQVHLFGTVNTDTLFLSFFLGFPCHHYFVDQFIWKPSKDSGLRRDLNLDSRASAAAT